MSSIYLCYDKGMRRSRVRRSLRIPWRLLAATTSVFARFDQTWLQLYTLSHGQGQLKLVWYFNFTFYRGYYHISNLTIALPLFAPFALVKRNRVKQWYTNDKIFPVTSACMWVYAVSTVTLLLSPVNTHVTLPEGGAGEVRHRQPDGDQPAGADITHVGGLLSGGLEARDGLTDCRPPLSRLSPLSAAAPGSFRQGMTLAHLTWL